MTRTLSVSEAGRLFDCEQQWDFSYGGHTTGSALRPKEPARLLREGRAWGAAVAAWHSTGDTDLARSAIDLSLQADAEQMREHGRYDQDRHDEISTRLHGIFGHYISTVERIPLFDCERQFHVAIPSRSGRRRSNRYVFVGYVDGLHRDDTGRLWIVEFKLRKRLSSFEQIAWARQIRWYAWAVEQDLGQPVAGVIVDERLNELPKPARVLASGKPSHAKDQLCTPDAYRAVCAETDEPVNTETLEALGQRRWAERHRVLLRRDEITLAGKQLVSSAQLIAELDAGHRLPVANPSQFRCPGCAYREICGRETDTVLIDALYERTVPKRLRTEESQAPVPDLEVAA